MKNTIALTVRLSKFNRVYLQNKPYSVGIFIEPSIKSFAVAHVVDVALYLVLFADVVVDPSWRMLEVEAGTDS